MLLGGEQLPQAHQPVKHMRHGPTCRINTTQHNKSMASYKPTKSEQILFEGVKAGKMVDLWNGDEGKEPNVLDGAEWGDELTVRAEVLKMLLTDSEFLGARAPNPIRLRHARISGQLNLNACTLRLPLDLSDCYFEDPIDLAESHTLRVGLVRCSIPALVGPRMRARGQIDMSGSTAGAINIEGAQIEGQLVLTDGTLGAGASEALIADGAEINGGMLCDGQFRAKGTMQLVGVKIRGQLSLRGAHLDGFNGEALIGDSAHIDGALVCDEGFVANGTVRLLGTHITGAFSLDNAKLVNAGGNALLADRVKIDGGMFCRKLITEGEARVLGARIVGAFDLHEGQFENAGGDALSADGIVVEGGMFCRGGFRTDGDLRLLGAHITGPLSLIGAHLKNPGNASFSGDGARFDGGMFCRDGFQAEGVMRLMGANVHGPLDLGGAQLINPGGYAVAAEGATFQSIILCDDGFRAEGELRFTGATIEGSLDFREAQLVNESGQALNLERASVRHLLLPTQHTPLGAISLSDSRIGRLDDGWPEIPYVARLNGLVYEALNPLNSDISERLKWLKTSAIYAAQPYEQLIAVLRGAGRDDAARRVAIAKEARRRDELNRPSQAWNYLLYVTVGYGYQAWRGVLGLVALVLVGWPVFAWAKAHHHVHATHDTGTFPSFHSWLYSLDSVLPVVNLGEKTSWSPSGLPLYWHTASVLIGWLLITLILGALTARLVRD